MGKLARQLAQPDARSLAVLLDEQHSRRFEGQSHYLKGGTPWFMTSGLKLPDSHDPDLRTICEILLAPI
jgi:hypothetical protein